MGLDGGKVGGNENVKIAEMLYMSFYGTFQPFSLFRFCLFFPVGPHK